MELRKFKLTMDDFNIDIEAHIDSEGNWFCPHCGEELDIEVLSGDLQKVNIIDGRTNVYETECETTVVCRMCDEDLISY